MGMLALTFGLIAVAAVLLRQGMIEMTTDAASLAAQLIDSDLEKLKDAVAVISRDTNLPALIQGGSANELHKLLETHHGMLNNQGLQWMISEEPVQGSRTNVTNETEVGEEPVVQDLIHSLTVHNAVGSLLERWPPQETDWPNGFNDRDWHKGALAIARNGEDPAPYVSRVFLSRTDKEDIYKFGISIAIMDPNTNEIVGVLLATVATAPSAKLSGVQFDSV